MTKIDDAQLDQAIVDAYANVVVGAPLKRSTMDAIHRAAAQNQDAESTVDEASDNAGAAAGSCGAEGVAGQGATQKDSAAPSSSDRHRARMVRFPGRRLVAGLVAACLCVALVGVGGAGVYGTETAYASITAQHAVDLGVNRWGRVISATSDDAAVQAQLDQMNVKGTSYDEAIAALVSSGILGEGDVDATVGADGQQQADDLTVTTTTCLSDAGRSGTCNGMGYGQGMGQGNGNGQGQGMGQGNGQGQGNGMGNGQNMGQGMGMGQGNGQGAGQGKNASVHTSNS